NISEKEREKVIHSLKKQRYKIVEEDGHVLAEKNRFSRWGPYVNHIGLIIILLATLLRITPFFYLDDYVWIREGEQIVIPGTDNEYYIENDKFTLEVYDEDDERFREALERQGEVHKNYQTDVTVYKTGDQKVAGQEVDLEKLKSGSIKMNQPFKLCRYTLYQSGYQQNEFKTMSFKLYNTNDADEKSLGDLTIDLRNPERTYVFDNDIEIKIEKYYPDYVMDDGEPRSETN